MGEQGLGEGPLRCTVERCQNQHLGVLKHGGPYADAEHEGPNTDARFTDTTASLHVAVFPCMNMLFVLQLATEIRRKRAAYKPSKENPGRLDSTKTTSFGIAMGVTHQTPRPTIRTSHLPKPFAQPP